MTIKNTLHVHDLGAAFRAVVAAIVAALVLTVSFAPTQARAADGTVLRTITAQVPGCSVSTGIAFDGVNLSLTCWYSSSIWLVSPADGHLVATYTPTNSSVGLGAIAYDRNRRTYWACTQTSPERVVELTLDESSRTYSSRDAFTAADGCIDGLAYDGTDDTLFVSGDVRPYIYHYSPTGQQLAIRDISGKLGNCLSSGLAVGGQWLFMSNNGCSQIYRSQKNSGDAPALFATYPERLEDMECDDVTFASTGKAVIWSKDAYDSVLNAFELNPGDCGYGGVPAGSMIIQPGYQQRYVGATATMAVPGPFDFPGTTTVHADVLSGPNFGLTTTFTCATSCDSIAFNRDYDYVGASSVLGVDTLRVWRDLENNGVRDSTDPYGLAFVKWNRPIRGVGMGDSYSSGEGVNPYDAGTDVDPPAPGQTLNINQCHRSAYAYSRQMKPVGYPTPLAQVAATGPPTTFSFIACAGAETVNVQTGGRAQYTEGATQLDQGKVTDSTDLVVLTLGGNDVGFGDVVTICGMHACLASDQTLDGQPVMDWVDAQISALPSKLRTTLLQIKAAAPNATVVLMGYPRLFPATASEQSCAALSLFGSGEMPELNAAADRLDAAMRATAAQAGVHYVSSLAHFAGHEVCGAQGEWLNGTTAAALNDYFRKQWVGTGSFHPNRSGQVAGYASQLDAYLKQASESMPTYDTGLPRNPDPVAGPYSLAEATPTVTTTLRLGSLYVTGGAGDSAAACLDEGLVRPGATVRVYGEGFAAGASIPVVLEVTGASPTTVGTVVADPAGRLLGNVTMPSNAIDSIGLLRAKAPADQSVGGDLELIAMVGFARDCPAQLTFTGFWEGSHYFGAYAGVYAAPSWFDFGFQVKDASGAIVTDPARVTASAWDAAGATIGATTFNAKSQRFEIRTRAPSSFAGTPRNFSVTLDDGARHSIAVWFGA